MPNFKPVKVDEYISKSEPQLQPPNPGPYLDVDKYMARNNTSGSDSDSLPDIDEYVANHEWIMINVDDETGEVTQQDEPGQSAQSFLVALEELKILPSERREQAGKESKEREEAERERADEEVPKNEPSGKTREGFLMSKNPKDYYGTSINDNDEDIDSDSAETCSVSIDGSWTLGSGILSLVANEWGLDGSKEWVDVVEQPSKSRFVILALEDKEETSDVSKDDGERGEEEKFNGEDEDSIDTGNSDKEGEEVGEEMFFMREELGLAIFCMVTMIGGMWVFQMGHDGTLPYDPFF